MDITEALRELTPRDGTTTTDDELVDAAREAWRRRQANTEAGAAVIEALHQQGLSYRDIERLTGIPYKTAQRWATPPTAPGR